MHLFFGFFGFFFDLTERLELPPVCGRFPETEGPGWIGDSVC